MADTPARRDSYPVVKRIGDFALALVLLLVFGPLMLLIAALIRLTSPGPALYMGERGARGGGTFRILKFRSMVADAEKKGGPSTSGSDARITSIGRLIRATKLDELPQLINVLKGEMSFVGPRPEVMRYVSQLAGDDLKIMSVRPGITDWASIWNSDEGSVLAQYDDADEAYERVIRPTKLALQRKYVDELSLTTDLKILFGTARRLLDSSWLPAELREYPTLRGDDPASG